MSKWNPSGIVFALAVCLAGYCFGDKTGLGISAIIVALVQFS